MNGIVDDIIEKAAADGARSLSLADVFFWDLPPSIASLTDLEELNLSGTQLTSLPAAIGRLFNLRALLVDDAKLTSLPASIGDLQRLELLDLSRNRLKELPGSIGRLANLRNLQLSGNLLSELPSSVGGLANLRGLYLEDNRLADLPESLAHLENLEALFLHGNPALGIANEMLGPRREHSLEKSSVPPAECLEYYLRLRQGSRPLNEAKLLLVGRGNVGKTSLVRQLLEGTFDPREVKTDGIRIRPWNVRLRGSERVRLNIWDFGGQEIMHATHQFFLTQRSVYLLVLNGREGREDADAEYWLKIIESFGGESPVIVVLNKIKEQPFDLNRRALQQKYPAIREFLRTDCAQGLGIIELRQAIERETDRLEHLRDAFPASWFAIKERLAGAQQNFLSFEEYRRLCAALGEDSEPAQASLAGYLHNLGIALNYKDDPRLADTHVLNPHWVTNGIYKILNAETLERQRGAIGLGDFAQILDPREYPVRMHRFLVDLMKKFDLCFSFPDDDTRFLIPELLDKQEPAEAAAFNPDECLNFQYHYQVLPEGLLPRFIVRTHARSEGRPRWRTGVILGFEDSTALVKADVHDRKVFISVAGPAADRRRLLAVIRSYFEEIHRNIPRLQPTEMVPLPADATVVERHSKLVAFERKGFSAMPVEFADGSVAEVDVGALLNGVDVDEARREPREASGPAGAIRLFYSYAHADERYRDELEAHLKLLQRRRLIETWHDRKIQAGDNWKTSIAENLERAGIIVLLVSSDFLKSDYIWDVEMRRALERHACGEARVVPVIVRDVSMKGAPFEDYQVLPRDRKAVELWESRDSAWRTVTEHIEALVHELTAPRAKTAGTG